MSKTNNYTSKIVEWEGQKYLLSCMEPMKALAALIVEAAAKGERKMTRKVAFQMSTGKIEMGCQEYAYNIYTSVFG